MKNLPKCTCRRCDSEKMSFSTTVLDINREVSPESYQHFINPWDQAIAGSLPTITTQYRYR